VSAKEKNAGELMKDVEDFKYEAPFSKGSRFPSNPRTINGFA
jgi:hypothetical protein